MKRISFALLGDNIFTRWLIGHGQSARLDQYRKGTGARFTQSSSNMVDRGWSLALGRRYLPSLLSETLRHIARKFTQEQHSMFRRSAPVPLWITSCSRILPVPDTYKRLWTFQLSTALLKEKQSKNGLSSGTQWDKKLFVLSVETKGVVQINLTVPNGSINAKWLAEAIQVYMHYSKRQVQFV
ncbi:MAG TPA: hypothetical protein VFZ02_05040 [Ktedonobacteraceae bacterium]